MIALPYPTWSAGRLPPHHLGLLSDDPVQGPPPHHLGLLSLSSMPPPESTTTFSPSISSVSAFPYTETTFIFERLSQNGVLNLLQCCLRDEVGGLSWGFQEGHLSDVLDEILRLFDRKRGGWVWWSSLVAVSE